MRVDIVWFLYSYMANVLFVFLIGTGAGRLIGRGGGGNLLDAVLIFGGIVLYAVTCLGVVYNSGLFVR